MILAISAASISAPILHVEIVAKAILLLPEKSAQKAARTLIHITGERFSSRMLATASTPSTEPLCWVGWSLPKCPTPSAFPEWAPSRQLASSRHGRQAGRVGSKRSRVGSAGARRRPAPAPRGNRDGRSRSAPCPFGDRSALQVHDAVLGDHVHHVGPRRGHDVARRQRRSRSGCAARPSCRRSRPGR